MGHREWWADAERALGTALGRLVPHEYPGPSLLPGWTRAHVLGHSLGAAVTLQLAVGHPDRVRSIVPVSASVRPEGMHEDLTDPSRQATSKPTT